MRRCGGNRDADGQGRPEAASVVVFVGDVGEGDEMGAQYASEAEWRHGRRVVVVSLPEDA